MSNQPYETYEPYPAPQAHGAVSQPLPPEVPAPASAPHGAPFSGTPSAHRKPDEGGVAHPPPLPGTAWVDPHRPSGTTARTEHVSPTTGTAALTAAQRARAEGRSPVIEPGVQPAALTAVLGLLLSGAAAVGQYALLVPLVVLQAVTAAGWFRLNGMWPARQGIALAFAGALVADAALLAAGRGNGPAVILGTLGVWVLLALVLHLRSHAAPDERLSGLTATVASAALAVVAAGHLAAEPDAVTVGGAAVAAAVLVNALLRALSLPSAVSVVLASAAAAGAGVAVGGIVSLSGGAAGTQGALPGLGAGVCALIGHRVASYDYPSRFVHMTAGVALPLAAAAPAVYVLGRGLG